jgi:hypothetical protein
LNSLGLLLCLALRSLYGLHMGDEGAAQLALALRVSPDHHVDNVNLCRNEIGDRGESS